MLASKQKEWLWQDRKKAKDNGEDIPVAKKSLSQSSAKLSMCFDSAMAPQKRQISSLTAQNQKMIMVLIASGIDIPDSDPSSDKEDGEDCKMAANKKNSNLTKTNKRRK